MMPSPQVKRTIEVNSSEIVKVNVEFASQNVRETKFTSFMVVAGKVIVAHLMERQIFEER